jgi:nucleoside-diphosphate-sugar epimerase
MTKRALLLGGTGAMGIHLAPALAEAGFTVDVTTRTSRSSEMAGINFIIGNAQDDQFVTQLLRLHRYDVLVDFMLYGTDDFTQRLPTLLAGTEQYFLLSSYRVFANASILTETSPRLLDVVRDPTYLKTDEYALAKARQEDVLRASDASNWTIVRPGITYSTGRFQLGTLEANMVVWRSRRQVPVAIPKLMLEKQTTLTWAGDVAKLLTRLAGNAKAFGEDFNVVTAEHHSWRYVAGIYHEVLGTEVCEVETEDYIKALGEGLNNYQVHYDRMFDRVLDNRKVLGVTGFSQGDFTSLRAGLIAELHRFLEKPSPLIIDFGRQARFDALTHSFIGFKNLRLYDIFVYLIHRLPGAARAVGPVKRALQKLRSAAASGRPGVSSEFFR